MAIVLAKVWPLEPGVMGIAPHDNSALELSPGTPGFMDYPDAVEAEKEGRVQLMAGRGWNNLHEPRTEAKPKAAPKKSEPKEEKTEPKNEYRTVDMKPSESAADETTEDPNTYKVTEMKPKRGPGRPRKDSASPKGAA